MNRFGGRLDPWSDLDWPWSPRGLFTAPTLQAADFPPVNIWVNGDDAILTSEIPGMDPSSLEISVAGKTVTLRGRRAPEELKDGTTYHRQERSRGQFSRSIGLPFNLDADHVEATFKKGVLVVTLPKAATDRPKTIQIKSESGGTSWQRQEPSYRRRRPRCPSA